MTPPNKVKQVEFVQATLGEKTICSRCEARLDTFSEVCVAALDEVCPGFAAIEQARADFAQKRGI